MLFCVPLPSSKRASTSLVPAVARLVVVLPLWCRCLRGVGGRTPRTRKPRIAASATPGPNWPWPPGAIV